MILAIMPLIFLALYNVFDISPVDLVRKWVKLWKHLT